MKLGMWLNGLAHAPTFEPSIRCAHAFFCEHGCCAQNLNDVRNDIIEAMGSEIEDYLVQIIGDRHPRGEEVALIQAYIRAQIDDLDCRLVAKLHRDSARITPRIKEIIDARHDLARKLDLLTTHYDMRASQS